MGYDAVIFDKDGVILDSGDFKWADKLRVKIAEERGVSISTDKARKILDVQNRRDLQSFLDDTGLKVDAVNEMETEIADRKIEMMEDHEIDLVGSARKVLESLDTSKALVSNAPMKATKFTLNYFGISRYFDCVRSPKLGDMGLYMATKKPHPRMINEVIREVGAEKPLMVGDSESDVKAAKNAGIESAHIDYNGATTIKPTYSIESLEEVLEIADS